LSKKNYFASDNYLLIYLGIIIVINILLLFIPLTNIFGYEFSAVNALLLFFLSGVFAISNFKKLSAETPLLSVIKRLLIGLSLFTIIPLSISCVNSVFGNGCSFTDGFLFYTFITLPSIFAGTALGVFVYAVFPKYRRPVFLIIYFILFLIPVFEFFINPQVYFFTPLIGYFPGTIYDEGLSINAQIIIYRILNLLFYGALFSISLWIIGKSAKSKIIFTSSLVAVAVVFLLLSSSLGFSTTKGRLTAELDKKIETEHFIIHFSNKIDDNFVRLISLQHEFYYSELVDFFNYETSEKITSFVFYDRAEKKQLMGSENADVAKPWLYQLFTSYENYNSTLKHELAHIFTAEFGKGLLKVADSFNPSLIEGIAMAADPVYGENNLDYMAALAYNNGYKTDLKNLYNHFNFFNQTSSLSYIYAGSFTKFLIDTYGIEKFKKLYVNLDFKKVYGVAFQEITRSYFGHLKTIDNSYNVHAANYFYGKKSIFFKTCPRHVSEQIQIAWEKYNSKSYCEARDIFKQSYELSDDFSALYGYINSLSKLKERTVAIDYLEKELFKFEGTSSYYNLELRLADLYAEEGEVSKADSFYLELIRQNPARNFYYIANTRMYLARENSTLKMYLGGSDFTKYYLLKRLYYKRNNYNFLPIMIDLSRKMDEDYRLFISQFSNHYSDGTYESSYAFYKLSNYMLENLDFSNARKMAALALRFKEDVNFSNLLERNHYKIMWLQNNQESLLAAIQGQM
jgi:hypothetical protein